MAANLNYLYISELRTGICVSALGFSWLNTVFPSTTTIHLYYYQCRWHTVDINAGQTPVIACDQPLFKIAKDVQWSWPLTHGEDSYVVMLGGLHINMTLLKCLCDLLDGSGWTSAILHAQVASPGTPDSVLKASHVKKTARAHQVTACDLYNLRQDAYIKCGTETTQEAWSLERRGSSVQFRFWELILNIELAILTWAEPSIKETLHCMLRPCLQCNGFSMRWTITITHG